MWMAMPLQVYRSSVAVEPRVLYSYSLKAIFLIVEAQLMDLGTGLNLVGIAIGVVFGVTGLVFAARKINKSRSQKQSVGKGGVAIQSGRDTKIEK